MGFNPSGGGIGNANDVALNNPAASQFLGFDTNLQKWRNGYLPLTDPSMGGDISGTASNAQIVAGAVGTTELSDNAVTTLKLNNGAVTDVKIASGLTQSKVTNLVSDLAAKVATTQVGTANGVASLDATGKVPSAQLPTGSGADTTIPMTTQSGTSYTLGLADAGSVIETTSASAVTVTIPTNATVALPVGSVIEVMQAGTGQVTFTAASGVTLRTPASQTTRTQWSTVGLRKRFVDTWVLSGDLT